MVLHPETADNLRKWTLSEMPAKKVPRVTFYDTSERDGWQNPVTGLSTEEAKNFYLTLTKPYQLCDRFTWYELVYAGSSNMDRGTPQHVREHQSPEIIQKWYAFWSSIHKDHVNDPGADSTMKDILGTNMDNVTIFVKSDISQVEHIIKTSWDHNLEMIRASVEHLRSQGKNVIVDMEHFFDGFKRDPEYAKECILAAIDAGAQTIVLCETVGGKFAADIDFQLTKLFSDEKIQQAFSSNHVVLGFHPHNDCGQAVESSRAFILNDAIAEHVSEIQIQGNLWQAGERIGNANLFVLACDLYQMGLDIFDGDEECWNMMRWTAQQVSKILTGEFLDDKMPYIGWEMFTHSAWQHTWALAKDASSYDLTNIRTRLAAQVRIALSPQSGKGNVKSHLAHFEISEEKKKELAWEVQEVITQFHIGTKVSPKKLQACVDHVVDNSRIHYSDAWAQAAVDFWEIVHETDKSSLFEVKKYMWQIESRDGTLITRATVHLGNDKTQEIWKMEGKGILHNLSESLKLELWMQSEKFHVLSDMELVDYHSEATEHGTASHMRCTVVFRDNTTGEYWSTQAIGQTNDEAGFLAIQDAFRYKILMSEGKIKHYQDSVLMEKYATREEMLWYLASQKELEQSSWE